MLQEGKQILDLLVIQIHSAQLADPFRWVRSTQHYGRDIGWESLSERTKSPRGHGTSLDTRVKHDLEKLQTETLMTEL